MASETQSELNRMLLEYAQLGKTGLAQMMLVKGARLDAIDDKHRNVLHLSALLQHPDFVIWALEKDKIKVDETDIAGETPLVKAAAEGTKFAESLKSMKALLGKGAKVNSFNPKNGTTALMAAATYNNVHGIRLLLQEGARIDDYDFSRTTALMAAVCTANCTAASLLIDSGANPLLTDKNGYTALDYARRGSTGLTGMLEAYEEKYRQKLLATFGESASREMHAGIEKAMRSMKPLGFKKPGA